MKNESKLLLAICVIILSNIITYLITREIVSRSVTDRIMFAENSIIFDDERFVVVEKVQRSISHHDKRGAFGSGTRYVENVYVVPTADSAVRIADTISSAMTCERYGDFNPFEHDVGVRFYEDDNVWEVFYYITQLSRESAINNALSGSRAMGKIQIGPSIIINKTNGEIIILHEGFAR